MVGEGGSEWKYRLPWLTKNEKLKKKHWLKRPKAVPQKLKLGPKYKWFKISYLFLKIFFRVYNLSPPVAVDIIRVSFIPEFVAENLKSNKSQPKRSLILKYRFAQKTSLILRISTLIKLKITCSQNTAKTLSQFTNFPESMFLFDVKKSICPAPFPVAQELLYWTTLKVNFCIFLYISLFVLKMKQDLVV